MGVFENINLVGSSEGLVLNGSAVDAPANSFQILQNADVKRPGLVTNLRGSRAGQISVAGTLRDIPSFPSGITPHKMFIREMITPSVSDIAILYGQDGSSNDKLYVWPSPDTAGAWQHALGSASAGTYIQWLDLTEKETATIATVGSTTVTFSSALDNESITDYYKNFILIDTTTSQCTFVTASAGSVLTIKYPLTGAAASDSVALVRFPIFKEDSSFTPHFSVDNQNPFFVKNGDETVIHTGAHDPDNTGFDLHLSYVNDVSIFADSDLDYKGFWFDINLPFKPSNFVADKLQSFSVGTASTDNKGAFPYSTGSEYYVIDFTAIFENDNESNLFYAKDGTSAQYTPTNTATISNSDSYIDDLKIGLDFRNRNYRLSDHIEPSPAFTSVNGFWSRRIKKLRVWLARAEQEDPVINRFRPFGDYFLVREIDIDDTAWSFNNSTQEYEYTIDVEGHDWNNGQAFPYETVAGYRPSKVYATADQAAVVAGRSIIAPIYDDSYKGFRALFSPRRLSGETSSQVYPIINRVDAYADGIPKITAVAELDGRIVLADKNELIFASVDGIVEVISKQKGILSNNCHETVRKILFFCSYDSMLEAYDGINFADPSPGWKLQDVWDSLTQAQKEAVFTGYYKEREEIWVKAGSRIFIYSIRLNNWKEYVSNTTYTQFLRGQNEKLYGLTNSSILELVSGNATESLTFKIKPSLFGYDWKHFKRLQLAYKSDTTLVGRQYDEENVSDALKQAISVPLIFIPKKEFGSSDSQSLSFRTHRGSIELESNYSGTQDIEIDNIRVAAKQKRIN